MFLGARVTSMRQGVLSPCEELISYRIYAGVISYTSEIPRNQYISSYFGEVYVSVGK